MNRLKSAAFALGAWLAASGLSVAFAQQYPNRPVRIVVPYAAGGATDVLTRHVAEKLAKRINQPVVVENKPGANGLIGAKFVSDAAPDGSTLVVVTPGWPATPVFVKSSPVEVPGGLEPVALLAEGRFVLAAGTAAPFSTFAEFVAYGRANPGKINYASGGVGDSLLLMENVRISNRFEMTRITYPGVARTITALLANEVHLAIVPENVARQHASAGKMRILAISGPARSSTSPEVPTFAELGFPAGRNNWFALMAARGTSPELAARIHADIAAVMADPDSVRKAADLAMLVRVTSPEELRQLVARSITEYKAIADQAGIKPE